MNPPKKKFSNEGAEIRRLIRSMGACIASDRIMVDGMKVGFMYRELPPVKGSSGWNFLAGDESQEYCDNVDNAGVYDVNTVCNYDPAIIPYLESAYGHAFRRVEGTDQFEEIPFRPPLD